MVMCRGGGRARGIEILRRIWGARVAMKSKEICKKLDDGSTPLKLFICQCMAKIMADSLDCICDAHILQSFSGLTAAD